MDVHMKSKYRFNFKPVDAAQRSLVHQWLALPYVAEWFYGQGLANTIKHLDEFLQGPSASHIGWGVIMSTPWLFLLHHQSANPAIQ